MTFDLKGSIRRIPFVQALLRRRAALKYRPIPMEELAATQRRLDDAWRSSDIPRIQSELVASELRRYREGSSHPPFDTLVQLLKRNVQNLDARTMLEIGCSSGYYSEVLQLRNIRCRYTGCDYSTDFIELARSTYPDSSFEQQNATDLRYNDRSFDIVISGCCILHIVDYPKAISESIRVSREFVIFHRTPVLAAGKTAFFTKRGYNQEMIEIHFSEQELFRLFSLNGLAVVDVMTVSTGHSFSAPLAQRTYLCKRTQSASNELPQ